MADKLQRYDEQTPETVRQRPWVAPRVDIYENEQEVLLVADVPGVDKDDIHINLDREQLTIEGTWSADEPGDALGTEYRGRDYRRTFSVPGGIDADKIAADLKQGVLWLHLPKSDALKPRKIEVKSG